MSPTMITVKTSGVPGLLSLPIELTNEIIQELERVDLKQLRLTCKLLSEDCSIHGRLFDTLYVDLFEDSDKNRPSRFTASPLSFCAAVKSKKTAISSFVKRLVITGEQSPDFRPASKTIRVLRKVKALFSDKQRPAKALVSILPRLTGLESVHLPRSNGVYEPLVSSLTSTQSISNVFIGDRDTFYPGTGLSPFLPPFHNLKAFGTFETLHEAHLTFIIKQSSCTLTYLCFAGFTGVMSADIFSLWQRSPLRSITTYHDLPPSVWKALASTGIWLERICVLHPITHTTVIEYLDSYSGLCTLSLQIACAEASTLGDVFTKTLSKHRTSLTYVNICPFVRFSSSWVCNAEALLALSQCTRLQRIHVSISHGQSPSTVEVFLDLLPSWHSLSDVEFYTGEQSYSTQPPETSVAVVDCLLAFRTLRYTYAMQMLTLHCFIWKITPKVFLDGSYGFSARVSNANHPHDGEPYQGLAQHSPIAF